MLGRTRWRPLYGRANREVAGRAYSFYREQLSGLSIAKIYTRFYPDVKDTEHDLAVRERQNFGKKEDYGTLFKEKEAYNISFAERSPCRMTGSTATRTPRAAIFSTSCASGCGSR